MIRINKAERAALEAAGAIQYKLQRSRKHPAQDANFVTVNRQKSGRYKHVYIIETPENLAFLGRWDLLPNLQKINEQQVKIILDNHLLTEDQIQRPGEYKVGAVMFIARNGVARIKKVTELMKAVGIWK